jgi:Protein of unknown function (DUF2384)
MTALRNIASATQYPIWLPDGNGQSITHGELKTKFQLSETLTVVLPLSGLQFTTATIEIEERVEDKLDPAAAYESAAVAKATIRAAKKLGLENPTLSAVIGLSPAIISRMRNGEYELERTSKEFDLSVLFVRLYGSLDAIVSGDENVARAWLNNRNVALGDKPINLIQNVSGLVNVIQYLDDQRARV